MCKSSAIAECSYGDRAAGREALVNLQRDDALVHGQPWHEFPDEFAEFICLHHSLPRWLLDVSLSAAICGHAAQQEYRLRPRKTFCSHSFSVGNESTTVAIN